MNISTWVSLSVMGMRVATLAAKFGVTVVIARYLGLESLGVYGMIVGVVAIIPVMMSFGFSQSLARDASHESLELIVVKLSRYGSIVLCAYLAVLCVSGGVDLFRDEVFCLYLAVIVFLEHINNDVFNLLLARGRPLLANVLVFLRSALWIYAYSAYVIFDAEGRSFSFLLQFWIVGLVVTTALSAYALRNWPWSKSRFNFIEACVWGWGYVKSTKFLYVSELASNASFYLDRYLIGALLGVAEAGVYTFFSSIGMALYNLVSSGVMQVARPGMVVAHVQREFAKFDAIFRACFKKAVLFLLVLIVPTLLAFPWFAPLVKQAELTTHYDNFGFLLLGVLVRTVADLEGYKLYTTKRDEFFMKSTILCLLVSLFSNCVLIGTFKLTGAIASVWLSFLVTYIYRHRVFKSLPR